MRSSRIDESRNLVTSFVDGCLAYSDLQNTYKVNILKKEFLVKVIPPHYFIKVTNYYMNKKKSFTNKQGNLVNVTAYISFFRDNIKNNNVSERSRVVYSNRI